MKDDKFQSTFSATLAKLPIHKARIGHLSNFNHHMILKSWPNIKYISLDLSHNGDTALLKNVGDHCKAITDLSVTGLKGDKDRQDAMCYLLDQLEGLTWLEISDGIISSNLLECMAKGCQKVERMFLSEVAFPDGSDVRSVEWKNLEYLYVSRPRRLLSRIFLDAIQEKCSRVEIELKYPFDYEDGPSYPYEDKITYVYV